MGGVVALLTGDDRDHGVAITSACDAAPHRGPRREQLRFGKCMLAVSWADGACNASIARTSGLAAAVAGAFDNAAQLRRDLTLEGRNPDSTSAALLLEAFARYGEEAPAKLRGAYAAIVTDGRALWAFRDHLGLAPLCYRDGAAVIVASEAKQVAACAGISREPDLEAVEQMFFRSGGEETACTLQGVRRVPKATVLHAEKHHTCLRRYWHPERLLETVRLSADEIDERFHELMDQAVARTLTGSDVIALSGGIDAPAVAGYAAERHAALSGRPLTAVSAVYPRFPSVDERDRIEIVAGELGLSLHTFEPQARPLDRLKEWAELLDGAAAGASIPQSEELYLKIRELGLRHVLTGDLAEMVMGMPQGLNLHLLLHRRWAALRTRVAAQRANGTSTRALARDLAPAVIPRPVVSAWWRHKQGAVPAWIDERRAHANWTANVPRARDRWSRIQTEALYGPTGTLDAAETCEHVCGVRVRRPWGDIDLWEFFLSLPAAEKFPGLVAKSLARRMLRGRVPDPILDHTKKTVFDEAMVATVDMGELRRLVIHSPSRISGVNYRLLEDRLEAGDLTINELVWAKDLAAVHAFLSLW